MHKTVLLNEAIDNLNLKEDGVYVDATLGFGGHSSEKIKVIDCNYDEKGFFSKEYTIQSGEGEFL